MSHRGFRGTESKANQCMWDFVNYAAKVKPVTAVFESVQLAYSQGRSLMQQLRASLEEQTGLRYTLTHVLHNALSVGGPSMRKRYFWVVSQMPFGIERPVIKSLPTLNGVIRDLDNLQIKWETQATPRAVADPYAIRLARHETDGHMIHANPHTARLKWLLDKIEWRQGEYAQQVFRRYYQEFEEVPGPWQHQSAKLIATDFFQGFTSPTRWKGDEPARVITGAGLLNTIHPYLQRTLTHREVARIMGFNDAWRIEPLRNISGLFMTWGKGITVDCGRWIGEWIKTSLEDAPGSYVGELIGDREYLINVTNDWQSVYGTVAKYGKTKKEKKVTEVAEGTETEAVATRAGRPRSDDTVKRDDRVLTVVAGEYPMTTLEVAAVLNAENIAEFEANPPAQVEGEDAPKPEHFEKAHIYLSLWRLRRDGKVGRKRVEGAPDEAGTAAKVDHRWHVSFAGADSEQPAEAATDGELVAA